MNNEQIELANALLSVLGSYVDKDGLLYFKQKLDGLYAKQSSVNSALGGKVDKVNGKGLSTNDFTTAEKQKLTGIATGAQVNKLEAVKVNNVALDILEKAVNIDLTPYLKKAEQKTKTSQLTNDSDFQTSAQVEKAISGKGYQTSAQVEQAITAKGYQTSSQVQTAINAKGYQTSSQVQSLINTAVGKITGIDFQVVSALPTTGKKGVIYLKSNNGISGNIYDEYIWVDTKYEKIGTTDIDLSGYYNTTNFKPLSNVEIDTIFQ